MKRFDILKGKERYEHLIYFTIKLVTIKVSLNGYKNPFIIFHAFIGFDCDYFKRKRN